MKLKTQSTLANGGDAVARDPDGRVVFIEGAAPDEWVEVEIIKSKKKFAKARVLRVLEPSKDRVDPECDHYEVCGGCLAQHVSVPAQTRSKHDSFRQTLKRIGKVDLDSTQFDMPWTGAPYGYRNRARLALAPGNTVGFRAQSSNNIVDLQVCPVLSSLAQQALTDVIEQGFTVSDICEVEVITNDERALVGLPDHLRLPKSIKSPRVEYTHFSEAKTILANDGHGDLLLSPGVFAQSNAAGNAAMIEYIGALLPHSEHLIELYAGSGNFSRALAGRVSRLEIVEGAGRAIELAKQTLAATVQIHASPVEDFLLRCVQAGITGMDILMDPPRAGLSKDVVRLLLDLKPAEMIYVSCDPVTFARDLELMSDFYRLTQVRLFELYPHTAHTEVVGLIKAK